MRVNPAMGPSIMDVRTFLGNFTPPPPVRTCPLSADSPPPVRAYTSATCREQGGSTEEMIGGGDQGKF